MRLDKCEAPWGSTAYFQAKIDALVANLEAKVKATVDAALKDAILEALELRDIPSSTTTWMSLPTAAGSTLRIKEVCARQDAHLEAFMADFRSSADNLDQRQPSSHASFALLDDDDDDLEKDEAIPIAPLIDNANVEFKDIAVVHAPPSATSLYGCGCALPGGGMSAVVSQHAVGF
jgi:hypothetical protein